MLQVNDIAELKRRFKEGECSISRFAGAYVDADKNIVTRFNRSFADLEITEYVKYLEIVKNIYSTKLNDNVMSLEFQTDDVTAKRKFKKLIDSELKDDAAVRELFDVIVCGFDYVGNYLILLFYDTYDVIKRAADGASLDESEETYAYIQCIICPVELEKAGLQYKKNENSIGTINRDWIVKKPRLGFVYPAFEERSANREHVMYYSSEAKNTKDEFIKDVIQCEIKRTITQTREKFANIFFRATGSEELAKEYIEKVNASLYNFIEQGRIDDRLELDDLKGILQVIGIFKVHAEGINTEYGKWYDKPTIGWLFDKKLLDKYSAQIQRNKGKVLLEKAASELLRAGHSQLGEEIQKYIESTR